MLKDFVCLSGAMPELERATLRFDGLPDALIGIKILFASDFHYGGLMNDRRTSRIIDLIMSLDADMIALGGDYADNIADETAFCQKHLPRLSARYGVFCVPGNNDWEAVEGKYDHLRRLFTQAGARLIINESRSVLIGEAKLAVIGIDDCKRGSPNQRAFKRVDGDTAFRMLLSHSPSALDRALCGVEEKPKLVLCGHTHGGQLCIGGINPYTAGFESWETNKARKYFFINGEHDVDGVKVFVSNGIGCSILPIRIGAAPKIHLFTLARLT